MVIWVLVGSRRDVTRAGCSLERETENRCRQCAAEPQLLLSRVFHGYLSCHVIVAFAGRFRWLQPITIISRCASPLAKATVPLFNLEILLLWDSSRSPDSPARMGLAEDGKRRGAAGAGECVCRTGGQGRSNQDDIGVVAIEAKYCGNGRTVQKWKNRYPALAVAGDFCRRCGLSDPFG